MPMRKEGRKALRDETQHQIEDEMVFDISLFLMSINKFYDL